MAKATSTSVDSVPAQPVPATSLRYRPRDYFGRHDLQTTLLTQVKGTVRSLPVRSEWRDPLPFRGDTLVQQGVHRNG